MTTETLTPFTSNKQRIVDLLEKDIEANNTLISIARKIKDPKEQLKMLDKIKEGMEITARIIKTLL